MTLSEYKEWKTTTYPACVGLTKVGKYGRVHTVWNDMKGSRPTPWYMRLIPMKYIGWNREGAYVKFRR